MPWKVLSPILRIASKRRLRPEIGQMHARIRLLDANAFLMLFAVLAIKLSKASFTFATLQSWRPMWIDGRRLSFEK